jgi:hypothetical protein
MILFNFSRQIRPFARFNKLAGATMGTEEFKKPQLQPRNNIKS